MLVNFRRRSVVDQLSVDGVVIEREDGCKYLGTDLDHTLTLSDSTSAIFESFSDNTSAIFESANIGRFSCLTLETWT